ncbi:SAGA-associated factor 29-like isoform X1 [Mytilus galloprovincialis]|uniref:SGF29 C-terminal domain-containing protein n=2 Tax=Mytilus galloprovincialis TaxID=29158 RepID=A0A8B6CVL3_MYTGA|nr:Hypothetical predicted protein [Mytilus galloprovincialis]
MGRTKTISGGGGTNSPSSSDSNPASNTAQKSETRIKDLLKELYTLIHNVQDERARGEHNLTNISKTHERMQQEQRVTPYYKTKLKGLYKTAMQDAEVEAELLRKALDKISEIKSIREQRRIADSDRPKPIMRRGVLMSMLQQNASTLPLWVSKPGEKPPPLCGAVPADNNYIAKPGDKVAARVRSDDEENWILAEVVSFNASANKYDVDDIDADEGKERHTLSKRRIVALPIWKANPETDPAALFGKGSLVLALYPQTTCFYRALIHEPPKKQGDEYSVLFEDTSYPDGYSPPLMVAQRYVILCKEDKKK